MVQERAAAPTVEDVFRLARQGLRYEIVDGELIEMSPTGLGHGAVTGFAFARLLVDVQRSDLGLLVVGEVLFRLDPSEQLSLAPDIGFVARARVPPVEDWDGAFDGPPDLVVEVRSPGDRMAEMRRKARLWIEAGTSVVVLLLPKPRRVEVHRPGRIMIAQGDDLVDLSPAMPGVQVRARELFPA